MAKESLLDRLREHLEDVENYWLYFFMVILTLTALAVLTLCGVYVYTKR
jgi:hypothetical protein